jgi:hypothetical protein
MVLNSSSSSSFSTKPKYTNIIECHNKVIEGTQIQDDAKCRLGCFILQLPQLAIRLVAQVVNKDGGEMCRMGHANSARSCLGV